MTTANAHPDLRASIRPFPWGSIEGLPCLYLVGDCKTPADAAALLDELEAKLNRYSLAGTIVDLNDFTGRGAASLLVGINASERLSPCFLIIKPGTPIPSAGAPTLMLDLSEYFTVRPPDLAKWSNDILALAQVSPQIEQVKVSTTVAPAIEQLAQVFAAFRPQSGATLYVPQEIYASAMLSAAASGYPWMVRLYGGAASEIEVKR